MDCKTSMTDMNGEWLKAAEQNANLGSPLFFSIYPDHLVHKNRHECLISSDLHKTICYISLKAACLFRFFYNRKANKNCIISTSC